MITAEQMKALTIEIQEPFAAFLGADKEESRFQLNLLDVVRFAGHACPSMIGAFLISQKATELLFPQTQICTRGEVAIEIPNPATSGPIGPMANVFSYVFGAFEQTGFGGLQGQQFVRRNLLRFQATHVPLGSFRFQNLQTKATFDIIDIRIINDIYASKKLMGA